MHGRGPMKKTGPGRLQAPAGAGGNEKLSSLGFIKGIILFIIHNICPFCLYFICLNKLSLTYGLLDRIIWEADLAGDWMNHLSPSFPVRRRVKT